MAKGEACQHGMHALLHAYGSCALLSLLSIASASSCLSTAGACGRPSLYAHKRLHYELLQLNLGSACLMLR